MKFNYEHDYPINIQNLYDRVSLPTSNWEGVECGKKKESGGKKFSLNSFFGHVTTSNSDGVVED